MPTYFESVTLNIAIDNGDHDGGYSLYYWFNDRKFTFRAHSANEASKATSTEFSRNALMTTKVSGLYLAEKNWSTLRNLLANSYVSSTSGNDYQVEKAEFIIRTKSSYVFEAPRVYKSVKSGGKVWESESSIGNPYYRTKTAIFTPGSAGERNLEIKIDLRAMAEFVKSQTQITSVSKNPRRTRSDGNNVVFLSYDIDYAVGKTANDRIYFAAHILEVTKDAKVVSKNSKFVSANVEVWKGGRDKTSYCVGDLNKGDNRWLHKHGGAQPITFENISQGSRSLSAKQYSEWDYDKDDCVVQNSPKSRITEDGAVGVPCPNALTTEWSAASKNSAKAILTCHYPAKASTIKELEKIQLQGKKDEVNVYQQLVDNFCSDPNNYNSVVASGNTSTCAKILTNDDTIEESCKKGDNVVKNFEECVELGPAKFDPIMQTYCRKNRNHPKCECYNVSQGTETKEFCKNNENAPGCKTFNEILAAAESEGNKSLTSLLVGAQPYCATDSCTKTNVWQPQSVLNFECPDLKMCIQGIKAGNLDDPTVKQSCNISDGPASQTPAVESSSNNSNNSNNSNSSSNKSPSSSGGDDDDDNKTPLFIGIGVVVLCIIIILVAVSSQKK